MTASSRWWRWRLDLQVPGGAAIVAVARYIANQDNESAEFAVVVADAWHGRGLATQLMVKLIASARKKGLRRLVGTVLRTNQNMIHFVQRLGFRVSDDEGDAEQVVVELPALVDMRQAGPRFAALDFAASSAARSPA